ncbi:hypothetical protein ANCDUO_09185 [Ancylostoma duodenale]|uniref:Uncharacterized protein n=1 Tax=Ancylostoma duodenale TaxID=51022 RepID=A0A0C2GH98_9BILA|nr:hypothetical protein ANCDUO_09185 [Ancylostoma duodenale]
MMMRIGLNKICPCSSNRKLSNSEVDRKSHELAVERPENLGAHREKQPVEGSSSGARTESTERQSQEPEEVYDPLQKAAEFLKALIKRTAESQNWPLRRYRDVVSAVSDNDLYNKYCRYLDFRRRHLDGQSAFAKMPFSNIEKARSACSTSPRQRKESRGFESHQDSPSFALAYQARPSYETLELICQRGALEPQATAS